MSATAAACAKCGASIQCATHIKALCLDCVDIKSLNRVTRWRSQKRGYAPIAYHERDWESWRDDEGFDPKEAYAIADRAAAKAICRYGLPPAHDRADLIQIGAIAVWRRGRTREIARTNPGAILFMEAYHEILSPYRHQWEPQLNEEVAARTLHAPTSPNQGDEQWVEATMNFIRTSEHIRPEETERLEAHLSSNISLPETTRHKLHKIFHTKSRCEKCAAKAQGAARAAFGSKSPKTARPTHAEARAKARKVLGLASTTRH